MTLSTTVTLPTRSGIELDVRPASEADEALLAAFFDRVSEEDRRFRFLAAAEHVSQAQLAPMVQADHFRTESWLGFATGTGELVASGLLACDGPLDTGEIAISVSSAYRNKGIGWAMLDFLAKQAQERGCRRAISIESRDNHAAIELEREKGFVPEAFEGDPTLVILSKSFR
ncbi:GNAT family N-acetyltransferase [Novosphingobium sp. 1949]|uniref:GNAT family N-acetyltransferase n=1 Tax=Novosphingobium organovorum TaxID=2930092 RepID=A0ABT0B8J3_9SPHN|nr:N-acetyltransferase [Novosphingobium organovorum]MCJ2181391.1 GNAT family N-acetyltransferase [Novosphingobium organovorum]